jgi:hypothetical protein
LAAKNCKNQIFQAKKRVLKRFADLFSVDKIKSQLFKIFKPTGRKASLGRAGDSGLKGVKSLAS